MGAQVYIMDINLDRLRDLDDFMPKNVTTIYSSPGKLPVPPGKAAFR
jgi:alanine dehydrogenase